MKDFLKNIITDIRVELTEEFDRNFERKSFFGNTWYNTAIPNKRGSVMMRTGKLRRSIQSKQTNNQITWSSSLPYASLQNEGGEIIVSDKMKRFFWAMFYKANGAITKTGKGERNKRLSTEAQMWRNLALQKAGAKMKIKQRQFIGDHPQVRQNVEKIVSTNMKNLSTVLFKNIKP